MSPHVEMTAPRPARAQPVPVLTIAVSLVTLAVSVLGLLAEPVEHALRRDGSALSSGELWRLLTSLLVQDGGVVGTIFNVGGLVAVGIAAEHRLGRGLWVIAYLSGGLTGELVGWAGWQPIGAGNSVAVCGLAGCLIVVVQVRGAPSARLETIAPAVWATALASQTATVAAPMAAFLAGSAVAAERGGRAARLVLLLLAGASAALLLAQADIHGAALVAGLIVGVVASRASLKRWAAPLSEQFANDG